MSELSPASAYGGDPRPQLVKGAQEVLFATNRRVVTGKPFGLDAITSERAMTLTLGRALVSIPNVHKLGSVERPKLDLLRLRRERERVDQHFTIRKLSKLSEEEFRSALTSNSSSVLVFVHGYNVSLLMRSLDRLRSL